jgi:hypothetical protein
MIPFHTFTEKNFREFFYWDEWVYPTAFYHFTVTSGMHISIISWDHIINLLLFHQGCIEDTLLQFRMYTEDIKKT